ncbi:MAG: Uma2 family endonuclease, partial [Thermoanaerobaculia bacterium]
ELLSPKTAKNDRTVKKDLYAQVFHTPEYFLYDPRRRKLEGFRLAAPGSLVPTKAEAEGQRADAAERKAAAEEQKAEAERQRAEQAEAELARLRSLLGERDAG